jgi:hypothetical protein
MGGDWDYSGNQPKRMVDVMYHCINQAMADNNFSHSIEGIDITVECIGGTGSGAKALATSAAAVAVVAASLY